MGVVEREHLVSGMSRIRRIYQVGRKSTSLRTTTLVYDPETHDWWAAWVLREERDRRRARQTHPPQYAAFKRLMASPRSS